MRPFVDSWLDLVAAALTKPQPREIYKVGPLPAAVIQFAAAQGKPLIGYTYQVEAHTIRHAQRKHSDPAKEAARGQVALTRWHVEQIEHALLNPDGVDSAPADLNRHAFALERDFAGHGTARLIIEEKRVTVEKKGEYVEKRYMLLKTFYWLATPG